MPKHPYEPSAPDTNYQIRRAIRHFLKKSVSWLPYPAITVLWIKGLFIKVPQHLNKKRKSRKDIVLPRSHSLVARRIARHCRAYDCPRYRTKILSRKGAWVQIPPWALLLLLSNDKIEKFKYS